MKQIFAGIIIDIKYKNSIKIKAFSIKYFFRQVYLYNLNIKRNILFINYGFLQTYFRFISRIC